MTTDHVLDRAEQGSITRRAFVGIVGAGALVAACCGDEPRAALAPPLDRASGWRLTSPADVGVDAKQLDKADQLIERERLPVDALLVLASGHPVLERYYGATRPDDRASRQSVAKSVISALIGIAIDRGEIGGVEDRVIRYLGPRPFAHADRQTRDLRLRQLLTMTAGLGGDDDDKRFTWTEGSDWVSAALARKRRAAPGSTWVYDSASSHVLSAVITKATGLAASDYAANHIFRPIGVGADVLWDADPQGNSMGGWGIGLTPREMARFGQLFLRKGRWDDRQVLSQAWAEQSTARRVDIPQGRPGGVPGWGFTWRHYGYLWWPFSSPALGTGFTARGLGGQWIAVWPRHDAVAVIASGRMDNSWSAHELLTDAVIPAVRGATKA